MRSVGLFRSLRAQLLILTLVVLVPMIGFAAIAVSWESRHQREAVARGAVQTARALLVGVDGQLTSALSTLEAVATSVALRGDPRTVDEELRRVLASQPAWLAVNLAAPDGRLVASTLWPLGAPPTAVAERESFDAAVRTQRPQIGRVMWRPEVAAHTVAVRVPIALDNRVVAVVSALVGPAAFDDIVRAQRLPDSWVASIVDARNVHIARSRAPERFVGAPLAQPLLDALGRGDEGWVPSRTLEGQAIYAAFSRSARTGWTVALGVPVQMVHAPLQRSMLGLAGLGVVACLGAVAIAVLVARRLAAPIAALSEAAPTIVAGHRVALPPAGVTEIDVLARALGQAGADRARAESDLVRTSRLLAAVFDGTTDAVFVKDVSGQYMMINRAGADLLGRTVDDVVGKDDAALFTPESARRIMAQDRHVLDTGETQTFENTNLETTAGPVRTYLSMKAPYRDGDGRMIGVLGITRDITSRRAAEEARARALEREQAARAEAETANRAKDEFLAVLSHELRTPLNAVYGWARMLRAGQLDPATAKRAVEVIERNATAQLQLIEELLDISRIITGKMRLDVRPVDVAAVVAAAVDSIRPAAEAKAIRLHTVLDPRAGPVIGDPDRLQQIVWNLLANATKFTPRSGQVDVTLSRVTSHVEIAVSDTGLGIAPDVLPYVFDRFRQGDSTSTREHGGLGLGLALVRHLTELHGGTVTAKSEGEGKGACFVVKLPIASMRPTEDGVHPTASTVVPDVPGASLVGIRVLVVDDDADALDLVAAMLEETGAEVRTSTSTIEAMTILRGWRPDVLLSDLEMPGEDGYALLRRVQALERDTGDRIAVVALTAYGRIEDRVRTLSAGFAMHLPKPVDPAELVAVIGALARRRSETLEHREDRE